MHPLRPAPKTTLHVYANSDPHHRSPLPRRRRRLAEHQHDNRDDKQSGSTDPISLSSDEMQGRRLGGGTAGGLSAAAGGLPGRPRSQGDEGSQRTKNRRRRGDAGDDGGRETKTWRGRLEEGSGVDDQSRGKRAEKGPSLSSGKKFEDLDNYLRGCASASAARREKRKRRLGQGTCGGDSLGGTMTDGSSLSLTEGHEVGRDHQASCNRPHVYVVLRIYEV